MNRIRFWTMIFSFSLIVVGWFIYDACSDKSWGRIAVGLCNQFNGMAVALFWMSWQQYKQSKQVIVNRHPHRK